MIITIDQYFGLKINHPDATTERVENAKIMLAKVSALLLDAQTNGGIRLQNDPDTGTLISGSKGGAGDGGFRLQSSATGASKSSHKQGKAVDVYDPTNRLDAFASRNILIKHGLYKEAAPFTDKWIHLQDVPPRSGNRSFIP